MRVSQTRPLSSRLALHLLLQIPPTPLKKGGIRIPPFSRGARGDQGLTLIECLVAIIIIALTIVAITPPIMLATATRIQSRRADQANQIAQGEIDRIRTLVERGTYTVNDLPGSAGAGAMNTVGVAGPPTASSPLLTPGNCPATRYPGTTILGATSLVLVDVNGDCTPEYVMQVFRNDGVTPPPAAAGTPPYSFDMGVRVYTYFPNQAFPTLSKERASLVAATNARDARGGNTRQPMAVLYSTMARNDQSRSLGQICKQAGGTCSY